MQIFAVRVSIVMEFIMTEQKIITITGRSGSGKTTLIERLAGEYISEGKKVSVIKSMRHDFEVDREGKDTHRYRSAGVHSALITNGRKIALMADITEEETPLTLAEKYFSDYDIIIIEGFKEGETRKVEVIGDSVETPLFETDSNIVMVVSDREFATKLPLFKRDDIKSIRECIDKIY